MSSFDQYLTGGTDWDPRIPMCGNWQNVVCGPNGNVRYLNFTLPFRQARNGSAFDTAWQSGSVHRSPGIQIGGKLGLI